MSRINPKWEDYILWLATPSHERGAVATEEAWAKANGYSDARVMRGWKKKPEFIEHQKQVLGKLLKDPTADIETLDLGAVDFTDERDYRLVKTQLLTQAKGGNLKAAELYMKIYGKTWIDEETAARSTDYSSQDLEKLIATAASALAPELLAGALENLGWRVTAPEAA
jgi:hypothetical protein